jgi:hypothetical protein
MSCPIFTRLALGLLVAAVPPAAFAAGPCDGPGPSSEVAARETAWTNLVPENGTGQAFTATGARITGIEVDLVTGNPQENASDTLTLTLSTHRGDLLAEVETSLESGQDGWLCFALPEGGVDVRPGEALVVRLRDTGKVIFGWRYRNDTYPRGHALILNRADPSADFAFRVHDATAEPAS